MAERPEDAYPGQINAATAAYPNGSAKNNTADGDKLGTPWIDRLVNDIWGFDQALMIAGGVTPNGVPDTALVSDKLTALQNLIAAEATLKPGDYLGTSDPDILTRGFLLTGPGQLGNRTTHAALFAKLGTTFGVGDGVTTFGLPPFPFDLNPITSNMGSFGIPIAGVFTNLFNVAVNSENGDVWALDAVGPVVYKAAGGVGPWVATGDLAGAGGTNPTGISVDTVTGSVFVSASSPIQVYKLTNGAGSFQQLGDLNADSGGGIVPRGLTVDRFTGSVFVIESTAGAVFELPGGAGTWVVIATAQANASDITLNAITKDIWVIADGGASSAFLLPKGIGLFQDKGVYPDIANGVVVDEYSGNVFITSSVAATISILVPGSDNFAVYESGLAGNPVGLTVNKESGALWYAGSVTDEAYRLDGVLNSAAVKRFVKT